MPERLADYPEIPVWNCLLDEGDYDRTQVKTAMSIQFKGSSVHAGLSSNF